MTKKIRYGIVGIGNQGSGYAKKFMANFDKNAELTAVCDIDKKRIDWAEKTLKNVRVFSDYETMLGSGLIDVAMIVTPHYLHPQIAICAFEKGLNVLIDKPAGVYTKAVKEMNEVSKKYSKQLFGIMYNQRTDKLYIKAKQIIDSGELGELTRINWIITDWYRSQAYYNQGGWRGTWGGEGGGVLTNQCPHQLDLFTWLAGSPIKVKSYIKTIGRDITVENDVTAYCEFANGASGVFITSTHDAPGTNRLEITGTVGKIIIERGKLAFTKNLVSEPIFNKQDKVHMSPPPHITKVIKKSLLDMKREVFPSGHFAIVKNFSNVLLGIEDKLIAPGCDGLIGLTFSNAIHYSGWTNTEVTLPIDEDKYLEELNKQIEKEKRLKNNSEGNL